MASTVIGTELYNSGLGSQPAILGLQWRTLQQAGLDHAASWDAIRNTAVLEERDDLARLHKRHEPNGAEAYYTDWRGRQAAAVKAREERIEKLLNLQNPYRAPAVAS